MRRYRGFTFAEALIVVAILGLLMGLVGPAIMQAREAVRRTKCQQHLSGLGKALHSYAAEFKDNWPAVAKVSNKIDTMGSLWLLVKYEHADCESFVCPSDTLGDIYKGKFEADDPFPKVTTYNHYSISYSYQVPQHVVGSPANDSLDTTSFAVMADRSPFDTDRDNNGTTEGKLISALSGWASAPKTTGDDIRGWLANRPEADRLEFNSSNHRGDGQNVLYRDGHATWHNNPLVGIDYDNIYTRQNTSGATNLEHRAVGVAITDTDTPRTNEDSYLRTIRNAP